MEKCKECGEDIFHPEGCCVCGKPTPWVPVQFAVIVMFMVVLVVVLLLTGCTQQTNGALIWAIGDAVSETGATR